jgi:hypothetical protein
LEVQITCFCFPFFLSMCVYVVIFPSDPLVSNQYMECLVLAILKPVRLSPGLCCQCRNSASCCYFQIHCFTCVLVK